MKQSKEWLDKLALRMAEGWQALTKAQPYQGDSKLILAHDFALCARDLKGHIDALEAELAALRSQLKNITDNAYILENTIRLLRTENADREKAAIAAARLEEAEWWEHLAPDCGMPPSGNPDCIYCQRLAEIRSGITPDQSADRGGASQNEGQNPNGNPPTTEGSARTEEFRGRTNADGSL